MSHKLYLLSSDLFMNVCKMVKEPHITSSQKINHNWQALMMIFHIYQPLKFIHQSKKNDAASKNVQAISPIFNENQGYFHNNDFMDFLLGDSVHFFI